MLKVSFKKYQLQFKQPVLTSRGKMKVKNGYYLFISDGKNTGTGECSFIEGLSIDNLKNYEAELLKLAHSLNEGKPELVPDLKLFPSINFGYETALLDLKNGGNKFLFKSNFTNGKKQIPINGLVWMGKKDFMLEQIKQKLEIDFTQLRE